jgi:predicted negative regulator of RcsB-dependent stress response
VDEDLSELERLELVKKWWKENYTSILLGAVIAVVVVGGWRYWQYRTESRSEAASALYTDLATDMSKHDDAASYKTGKQIITDYADTPYAAHAALALAQVQATAGKLDEGGKFLDWVMQHSKDDGLKLLARLRLARLKLAGNDAQAALDTLNGAQDVGGFAPLYDALRGDAYAKLGKNDEARTAYGKALAAWSDTLGDRSLVQMKLDSLPTVAPKPAPAAATKAAKP